MVDFLLGGFFQINNQNVGENSTYDYTNFHKV